MNGSSTLEVHQDLRRTGDARRIEFVESYSWTIYSQALGTPLDQRMVDNRIHIHSISLGLSQAYLVEVGDRLVLVDAGMPHQQNRILKRIQDLGNRRLDLIFITHAHIDHYGSAAALRRATKASIVIHKSDAIPMARGETQLGLARRQGKLMLFLLSLLERIIKPEPTEADATLKDRDDLGEYGFDAEVLHTPGHTFGSSCLVVNGEIGFVGDLLSTNGKPHLQRFFAQDWSLLRDSIHKINRLPLRQIYPGHGARTLSGKELKRLVAEER